MVFTTPGATAFTLIRGGQLRGEGLREVYYRRLGRAVDGQADKGPDARYRRDVYYGAFLHHPRRLLRAVNHRLQRDLKLLLNEPVVCVEEKREETEPRVVHQHV